MELSFVPLKGDFCYSEYIISSHDTLKRIDSLNDIQAKEEALSKNFNLDSRNAMKDK